MAFVKFTGGTFRPDPKPPKKEKSKPKRINQQSEKGKRNTTEYNFVRKEFLALPENKYCFVEGCKRLAKTVEHRKGRKGFADDWARINDVPLLLDTRFFAPCCLPHNLEFESNPELSKKYQLSQIHDGEKLSKT